MEGRCQTTDAFKLNDKNGQVARKISLSFSETLLEKEDIHSINTNFNSKTNSTTKSNVEMKSQNQRIFPIFQSGPMQSTMGGKPNNKANQLDSLARHHHNHHRPKIKPKTSSKKKESTLNLKPITDYYNPITTTKQSNFEIRRQPGKLPGHF